MSMEEAGYIIKRSEDNFVNQWNQTRYIVYSVIQSQSTTSLKVTDVIKFPWEEEEQKENIPLGKTREEMVAFGLEMEKKLNASNGR